MTSVPWQKRCKVYDELDRGRANWTPAEPEGRRLQLSAQAREALLRLLPQEARESFQEIFAEPEFLFVAWRSWQNRITLKTDHGVPSARNGALMSINPNGQTEITAAEMSFEAGT